MLIPAKHCVFVPYHHYVCSFAARVSLCTLLFAFSPCFLLVADCCNTHIHTTRQHADQHNAARAQPMGRLLSNRLAGFRGKLRVVCCACRDRGCWGVWLRLLALPPRPVKQDSRKKKSIFLCWFDGLSRGNLHNTVCCTLSHCSVLASMR